MPLALPSAQSSSDIEIELHIDVFDSWALPSKAIVDFTGGRCGLPTPRRASSPEVAAPDRTPAPVFA